MKKKPGVDALGYVAATLEDSLSLSLFGCRQRIDGVGFTHDQWRDLGAYYGYDFTEPRRTAEEMKVVSLAAYEARLAEWQGATREERRAKQLGSGVSYETPPKPPNFPPPEQLGLLNMAGVDRDLGRDITEDGLRVMAFLAQFLEAGEDPVALVRNLCATAGYDVPPPFEEEEEEEGKKRKKRKRGK